MGGHTPGPWQVFDTHRVVCGDGKINPFCTVAHATAKADARLIAAVPDLLEAAQEAKVLIGARNDGLSAVEVESNINAAWHKLNAAIGKATGAPASSAGDL